MEERRSRTALRILAGVLIVLGLVVAAGAGFALPRRAAIEALLVTADASVGEDGVLYAGQAILEDPEGLGFERVLVQRPGAEDAPVLVFVHGVAAKGLDDARILKAVDAFVKGGFVIVAPEVPLLVKPPEADDDESRLGRLLSAVTAGRIEGAKPDRVGLVGISVGGALALRAAARWRSEGRTGVRAVLAIGSPDDLGTLAETWFETPRKDPDAEWTFEQQRRHDAQFARNVIFRAALGRRVRDPTDRDRLRTWLEGDEDALSAPPELETDEARSLAALAASGPDEWASTYESLLRDAWPLMRAFSPADVDHELPRLAGVTCFLLHGSGDTLVSREEYNQLKKRLSDHTVCVGLESNMIGHVDVDAVGLGEHLEHVVFMDDFFDAVGK